MPVGILRSGQLHLEQLWLRLQELREGLAVKVLDLSMAEDLDLELLRRELAEFPRR